MSKAPCECEHVGAEPAIRRVCVHLLGDAEQDHSQYFWGGTTAYHLICGACRVAATSERDGALRTVCGACYEAVDAGSFWDREHPFCGESGVRVAAKPRLGLRVMDVALGEVEHLTFRQLAAVTEGDRPVWLGLTDHHRVVALDLGEGQAREVGGVVVEPPLVGEVGFSCSGDGRFVALVERKGSRGVVFRVGSGGVAGGVEGEAQVVLLLNRGAYQVNHCEFPVAFIRHEGRACVIHASAWNRLEITDLETQQNLTERVIAPYDREQRSAHYLDYFYCRLDVSPDQERVMSAGWVWAPVGGVRMWSVRDWLTHNRFEAEDGPSVRVVAWRDYFWDGPGCWLGSERVVLWGYGTDDLTNLAAAWVFDATTGQEVGWFPGPPKGEFYGDKHLFVVSPQDGLSAWDVETGERIFHDPSHHPVSYHPTARLFLTRLDASTWRLSRVVPVMP